MADLKEKEKPSRLWMINTKGKPDVVMTLMVLSFVLSCLMAIAAVIETLTVGTFSIALRAFDMGFSSVVMVPLVAAYVGKRYTDAQVNLKETQMVSVEMERARIDKKKALAEEVPDEGA